MQLNTMKPLTTTEAEILESLGNDECRGPDHPEAKPEEALPFDVMTQLAHDRRVQAYECTLCSTNDVAVYHDRVTPAGKLALRIARLTSNPS
jgi:hypothetical protein